jgi:hypothetical protein
MAPRPDFFIVGAAKSGTTSLHDYLRQHPGIFMPAVKELNFFGSDRPSRHSPRLSLEEYLANFRGAPPGVRIGEASVSYLRSTEAAREIRAFAPEAQAIVMLRSPLEVMQALHAELVFLGLEDIGDFGEALAAEPDRRAGRRVPAAINNPRGLLYRDAVRYPEQLARYHEALGPDRVHVIVFDDFKADTAAATAGAFRFLGVDDRFRPRLEVLNAAKAPRSRVLQRLVASPPGWVRATARRLVPRTTRKGVYRAITRLNARRRARASMDPELAAALVEDLREDVSRLGEMIGRDLSAWLRLPEAA